VDILVSQPVWEKTVSHFIFRSADLVVVKGKKVPVQIHAVLSGCDVAPPAGLDEFEAGITAFRTGHFPRALQFFKNAAIAGLDDDLTHLYRKRCETLITEPPEHWEGVWVLKEK
jgi:hypothetical protein